MNATAPTSALIPLAQDRHPPAGRDLYQPVRLGELTLSNRMAMAPLTRSRAAAGNVPADMTADYYAQRASIGLIIAEATQVSAQAQGYPSTPGLHTPEQVQAWRKVTQAVHAQGGHIFVQLWHTGRISHSAYQPGGLPPGAPSAIAAQAKTFVAGQGMVDCSVPRALSVEEIAAVVQDFRHAARAAMDAGFDGVEVHGAHGYLIDAFLRDGSNHRNDSYGGAIANRCRFALEVMRAIIDEIGAARVGIRLSPVSPVNDSNESHPQALFEHLVRELDALSPVYIHVVEGYTGGPRDNTPFDYEALHRLYRGTWMLNNGYTQAMAEEAVRNGRADMVSFGRLCISNPDLVRRFKENAPLNDLFADVPLYGGGDAHGYTDYPALPT